VQPNWGKCVKLLDVEESGSYDETTCYRRTLMIFKLARITVALALTGLLCASFASAQPTQTKEEKKQAEEQKKQEEQQKKDNKKKPKNSDIENIGNRDINKHQINFMSYESEIAMGRQLAAEVEREVKLVDDPMVNEYVNRVGQNLVRNSDAKVPFTIKVVESDEINAFALPGGFFYVNSGLILAADDEAELAGVMAHEIAHVTARHGAEQNSKGQLLNIATIPLIFLGGPAGYGIRQASSFMIPVTFLSFSRGAEAEADYLGLQYMYKTGYDPTAAVSFFEKLQAKETAKPGTMNKLFSTHPPTGERIELEKEHIEEILPDREQYVVTTSEFNKVKAHLAELENHRPADQESNRPSLRRRTTSTRDDGSDTTTSSDDKNDPNKDGDKTDKTDSSDDDRPVLKRRP
jgi:predicted Zn-dependent protease